LQELMGLAAGSEGQAEVVVEASMVEVYNGRVRDLAAEGEGEVEAGYCGGQEAEAGAGPSGCAGQQAHPPNHTASAPASRPDSAPLRLRVRDVEDAVALMTIGGCFRTVGRTR
jgi:hypothetical protein